MQGGPWAGLGMPRLSQTWDFPGDLLRYPGVIFLGTRHHLAQSWALSGGSGSWVLGKGMN